MVLYEQIEIIHNLNKLKTSLILLHVAYKMFPCSMCV